MRVTLVCNVIKGFESSTAYFFLFPSSLSEHDYCPLHNYTRNIFLFKHVVREDSRLRYFGYNLSAYAALLWQQH